MKKLMTLLLGSALLLGGVACSNEARTSTDAPASTEEATEAPETDEAQTIEDDGTNDIRQQQLDSDIRAREERNDITGGDADRADSDLASEVRSKLEANLPASQLTVEAENGVVKVAGTVPTQPQYDRIDPLAREIKGVQEVVVDVTVVPAQPETNENQQ